MTNRSSSNWPRRYFLSCDNFPPLLTVHCRQNGVVDFKQIQRLMEFWDRDRGAIQVFYYFGQASEGHNLWEVEKRSSKLLTMLKGQITAVLLAYLSSVNSLNSEDILSKNNPISPLRRRHLSFQSPEKNIFFTRLTFGDYLR